jgi:ribosome maturation factor RimP
LERLHQLADPIVEAADFDLVEARINGGGRGGRQIQLFIDRWPGRGAVNIQDCASVSRKLGAVLELEDPVLADCKLEVSSPGIKRLLRNANDLARFAGIRARITLHESFDAPRETAIGVIASCSEATLELLLDGGKQRQIEVHGIARATLDPTHEQWLELGRKYAAEEAQVASPESADNPKWDEEVAMVPGEER